MYKFRASLTLCILSTLVLSVVHAEEPRSYWMTCNLRTEKLTVWPQGFHLTFKKATAGSRTRQPGPGECAWQDRGFYADEPKELHWEVDGVVLQTLTIDSSNTVMDAWGAGAANEDAAAMNWLLRQWMDSGRVRLKAYRKPNKQGPFYVTKIYVPRSERR